MGSIYFFSIYSILILNYFEINIMKITNEDN